MPQQVFPRRWASSACDGLEEVGTPVGVPCMLCVEPLELGARGFVQDCVRLDRIGEMVVTREPVHRECQLRAVVGSLGHLLRVCHCYGGPMEDPPSLTAHQAALAVWDYYWALGAMEREGSLSEVREEVRQGEG